MPIKRAPKPETPPNPDLRRLRASEIRDLLEQSARNVVKVANSLDVAAFNDLLGRDRAVRPLVLHNELLTIINRCIVIELEVRRQKVWWRRLVRWLRWPRDFGGVGMMVEGSGYEADPDAGR